MTESTEKTGIVTNFYMNVTEDNKLFGKVAFQTMGPKTDRIVGANMAQIEEWLDAGLLKNLDDEVVENGAVIMCYMLVNRANQSDNLATLGCFVDATGTKVDVASNTEAPEADADAEADDTDQPKIPF